jgi:C4-type Zn-finger protein
MKKTRWILTVLLAFVLVFGFAGCTQPTSDSGTVTLVSIAITENPAKTTYVKGEELNIAGLVVTGTYSDSTTKTEMVTAALITGYDKDRIEAQTLTITIEGKTATFTVIVIDPAANQATAFQSTHSTILGKTTDTVTITDEPNVDAALSAYNNLNAAVQALVSADKTLLDTLKAKITELKDGEANQAAATAFQSIHSTILGKTTTTVTITDEPNVDAALSAYNDLSAAVQALVSQDKTLLDTLKAKITELKDGEANQAAATAFQSIHSAVLGKTTDAVTITDEPSVDAALAAYNGLSEAVQALVSQDKTLLDTLKAKITELKNQAAVTAFQSTHSVVLGKTTTTVTIADEPSVDAALAAYNGLSEAVQALVSQDKTLLDTLKAKITELKGGEANQAAATVFQSTHGAILGKTPATVVIADAAAVDAALLDYEALAEGAKALLGTEKALLDALKVKIAELGNAVIKVTFIGTPQDEESTLGKSAGVLSWSANTQLVISADSSFTTYQWYLDGRILTGQTGNSLTLYVQNYRVGDHRASVKVSRGGTVYTKTLSFTVEQ